MNKESRSIRSSFDDRLTENAFAPRAFPLLEREIALMSGRLDAFLAGMFPAGDSVAADSRSFLRSRIQSLDIHRETRGGVESDDSAEITDDLASQEGPDSTDVKEPFDRLCTTYGLTSTELELFVLAGLAEHHEGYAQIFRTLHPDGRPRPTASLAAQIICEDDVERLELRRSMEAGTLAQTGLVRLEGNSPFYMRDLVPAESIWPVLQGIDVWPGSLNAWRGSASWHGLNRWLSGPCAMAVERLRQHFACTIFVSDDDVQRAMDRALAMVAFAGGTGVLFELPVGISRESISALQIHAVARRIVPVVRWREAEGCTTGSVPEFANLPGPAIVCLRSGSAIPRANRPVIGVTCDRLRPHELAEMWRRTLPSLAEESVVLAARFPVEPADARQVATDLSVLADDRNAPSVEEVAAAVRTRAGGMIAGGVKLVRPKSTWKHLILPEDRAAQLREAIARLRHQVRVLDEWRFLEGRQGARGVRILFSGPPGTGKTLSAEVMAHTLGIDLLQVDLSRVVSKWIGETEKNLAEAFSAAEKTRALLLFDEADALFGKRTEVTDAHDRYANLETAYLLARLEQFEGPAILSTNLRQNIDPAFTRRLEFIVEFDKPDREQRLALWKCHLPDLELLADDVDLAELAATYPMVGGLIRNAAVAAAFLAANEGELNGNANTNPRIRRAHFVQAIRREYEKTGQPFPGYPMGMTRV